MSNLDSVFNTFKSGADAYSNRFTDHSYNVANAGTVAGKKRSSYISTLNSIATPTTFTPAGVTYKPTIDIETIGGVTPTTYTSNFMINTKALCITNEVSSNTSPGRYGFTKVGTFFPDKNGDFVNHTGQFLKVVMTDPTGTPLIPNMAAFDQLKTLNLKSNVGLPQATTYMSLYAGLPGNIQPGANNVIPGVANTNAFSQAKLVYDAKGNEYNVVMTYTKINSYTANGAGGVDANGVSTDNPNLGGLGDPPNTERWMLTATATTNANPATPVNVSAAWTNGVGIVFQNGVPVMINEGNAMPTLDITPPPATAASPISMNIHPGTLNDSDGLTILGGVLFNNKDIEADGKGPGNFQGFSWDTAGNGVVSYTNGNTEIICKLPLITFKSMNSLIEGSGGVFYASDEAGPYTIKSPESGDIRPSAVESSTASATDTYVAMAQDGKRYNACIGGLGKTIDMLNILENLLSK